MPKYNVHMYCVYRVKYINIEAKNELEACKKVDEELSSYPPDYSASEFEFADEVTGFLVDVVGDEEYTQSCSYDYCPGCHELHKYTGKKFLTCEYVEE